MIDWQRGEEIDSSFKSLKEREKDHRVRGVVVLFLVLSVI